MIETKIVSSLRTLSIASGVIIPPSFGSK